MAVLTQPFTTFPLADGTPLAVTMTYDDVAGKVASFDWVNNSVTTDVLVQVNAQSVVRTVGPGPGQFVPGGAGIQLLQGRGGWVFPYSVSFSIA